MRYNRIEHCASSLSIRTVGFWIETQADENRMIG